MTDTKQNNKVMQIFMIESGELKKHTFSDAIEDGWCIRFGKHRVLDSYEHLWNKDKLGVILDDIFIIGARVAFYESEDMTEKAVQLLKEYLKKRKKREEEAYEHTLKEIAQLEKDLESSSFKTSKK